jgi:hypothetical protein
MVADSIAVPRPTDHQPATKKNPIIIIKGNHSFRRRPQEFNYEFQFPINSVIYRLNWSAVIAFHWQNIGND